MSASYASDVTVLPTTGEPWKAHISMNQPLHVNGVTLYQTQFMPETDDQGRPTGRHISVFTAAEDPGRFLKYLGGYVLVGGILLLYLSRPRPARKPAA
jgi:cytochrome c biogenesis protein ResB